MSTELLNVRSIFDRALDIASPADRTAYLDEVCAAAPEMRRKVEALLNAYANAGSFLEHPAPAPDVTSELPIREGRGSVIGPYKLLEQIGEGGMGVVFIAEQIRPVQRRVALKIIKAGMDTREVVARFEAERQALAMMEHPNIARVLDAGSTGEKGVRNRLPERPEGCSAQTVPDTFFADTGRPYFVMELVRGVPMTEFCNQKNLSIRERLELFVTVCQAVQHAHQKGIIHRDIKPTNVLVTLHDGRPMIKVIDFGVAKATGQKLTDKTLFTGFTQMIGTPLYMSPEQAEMTSQDIDTRSDIFSAGVLLYELLTGTTPFDSDRLKSASFDELRRIIREEEPPRPSTRLTTIAAEAASTVGTQRKSDPRQLSRLFRGELDWIVMKCLEKDRTRRYETASALASDVERYLHDEPVQACPPSARYRFGKFARRNKGALITATIVMSSLVGGIVGTTWGLLQAGQALDAESAQRQVADKSRKLADQQSELALKTLNRVVFEIQNKLEQVPQARDVRRSLLNTAIDGLKEVALNLRAAKQAEHALVQSHLALGDIFWMTADVRGFSESDHGIEPLAESLLETGAGARPTDLAPVGEPKPRVKRSGGVEAAREEYQIACDIASKLAQEDPRNAEAQRDLASAYRRLAKAAAVLADGSSFAKFSQRCFEVSERLVEEEPHDLVAQALLAVSFSNLGQIDWARDNQIAAARAKFQRALDINQRLVLDDAEHANLHRDREAFVYECLGRLSLTLGESSMACQQYQNACMIRSKDVQNEPHNTTAKTALARDYMFLASANLQLGDLAAARDAAQKGLELSRKAARDDPDNLDARNSLRNSYLGWGDASVKSGDVSAARDAVQKALEISEKLDQDDPSASSRNTGDLIETLGDLDLSSGNLSAARDDYQNALAARQRAAEKFPDSMPEELVPIVYEKLGDINLQLDNVAAARDYFRQALMLAESKRSDPQSPGLLAITGRVLARNGRRPDAAATAERLAAVESKAIESKRAENLVRAAEIFAFCLVAPRTATSPAPESEAKALDDHYAVRAVELLAQAKAIGYFKDPVQRAALTKNQNLDPLRTRDDFKQLLAESDPKTVPVTPESKQRGK
jgi:eukaryotic-like serine/threonine-protein kinase